MGGGVEKEKFSLARGILMWLELRRGLMLK